MTYVDLKKKNDTEFRQLLGVNKLVFQELLEILWNKEKEKTTIGGRPYKLPTEERLAMTLRRLFENRTYHSIAAEYNVIETSALRSIRWVEDTLMEHPQFKKLTNNEIFLKSRK